VADKEGPSGGVPPGVKENPTTTPDMPLLELSTTLNLTRELVGRDDELAVEVPMMEGVADVNCILLAAGGATVIVALLVSPVTDAVIASELVPQPLSL
jgi:hypothetical protein